MYACTLVHVSLRPVYGYTVYRYSVLKYSSSIPPYTDYCVLLYCSVPCTVYDGRLLLYKPAVTYTEYKLQYNTAEYSGIQGDAAAQQRLKLLYF